MQLSPAASVVLWQVWLALNALSVGAPPNMLMGPKGAVPLFVSVTEPLPVAPEATLPKLISIVEMVRSVSTPPLDPVGAGSGVPVGRGVSVGRGVPVGRG